jgi:small conductance mechanosensitive channel
MEDWLERGLAALGLQEWAVTALAALLKILVGILLFLVTRALGLRALDALFLPVAGRARRDGDSGASRLHTLQGISRSAFLYLLLFTAVVMALGQVGIDVRALLAGAGVLGLALSFGAQRLVRDWLTGFFMLLEDQFRVGELVTLIGGPGLPQFNGTVLEVGLRITRLQDLSGKLVTVGNGDVVSVINHSRGPIIASVELGVAPETAVTDAAAALAELGLSEALFSGSATLAGVTGLDAGKMVLRVTAPAQPARALEAELALREACGNALRSAGIEIR